MNHFVWNIRPEIFDIGYFSPRWYGLLFALGIFLGNVVVTQIFHDEGRSEKNLSSLLLYAVLGTVIGARLGHCLLYEPSRYLSSPWEILNIREGGLASHGGFAGVLIAIFLYLRNHREMTFLELSDRLTVGSLIGAFFIRLGNFFNSEIYGPPTNLPWAIVFSSVDDKPRHPSMLYEALAYFFIFCLLYLVFWRTKWKHQPGRILGAGLVLCFTARFLIEFVKVEQVPFEVGMLLNMGQLLSLPFIAIGGYLILNSSSKALAKPVKQRVIK